MGKPQTKSTFLNAADCKGIIVIVFNLGSLLVQLAIGYQIANLNVAVGSFGPFHDKTKATYLAENWLRIVLVI